MHWVQKQTLKKLILEPQLRFSQLKPEDVESNLFMYHLRQLLGAKLVAKAGGAYRLSAEGKRYADKLSWKTLNPRTQPKIVTMIACRNRRGEWLVYRRRRQPFRGLISFPHGKLHLGENLEQAALRELKEKTGLIARLRHRGETCLTVYQGKDLISQALCHVFTATGVSGTPAADPEYGECFWHRVENPAGPEYGPGFADILKLVEGPARGHSPFFNEFSYTLPQEDGTVVA